MQGKRTKQAQGAMIQDSSKVASNFTYKSKPTFVKQRNDLFSQIKKKNEQILEKLQKPQITIKVNINQIQLKDGKQIKGQAFVTTPLTIAKGISKNLAEASIVARITYTNKIETPFSKGLISAQAEEQQHQHQTSQYQLFDMSRPLQGDCNIEFVTFEQKQGKQVFWHSSAHLLGQSLQTLYGAWLCHGPPLDNGFFYDSYTGNQTISQNDYQKIQKQIKSYSQSKQIYERIVLTKQQALQMFKYNPFKTQLIESKIPEQGYTSAYRCGNLIDLCTGPHIPSASLVKGFKVTKNSSAYWLGKKQNDGLQRVYAISFPKQSLLDEFIKAQQQLAKRDHRTIGPKQDLFHFTTLSPGSALFYPHGTVIYSRLTQLMRGQYKIRGYDEVISPNVYSSQLWKISGHYFKYKDNIFWIKSQNEQYGLKPMNCPGHCVMFGLIQRSYKDLPIRFADFGVLHRNEITGALSGLTRVRRFQQDDGHIFCTPDQIQEQIVGVLDLLDYIYGIFGFKYLLELSTRPQQFLGEIHEWDKAEAQLTNALNTFGKQYKINHGDGAFYGPKIDVKLFDVFGRQHQCGTIQLDFQLPQRFNLQFRGAKVTIGGQQNKQEKKQQKKNKKQGKGQKQKVVITPQQRQRLKQEKLKKKQQEAKKKEQQQLLKVQQEASRQIKSMTSNTMVNHDIPQQQKFCKIQPLKNGFQRPVIIHRAIFGSLERFIAILCEHTGGKWDFWVSPRQLKIVPLSKDQFELAQQIRVTLMLKGYSVDVDTSSDKLDKKIRNAQIEGFNYIGVIGKKEAEDNTITLRKRDTEQSFGTFTIPEVLNLFGQVSQPPKSKKRVDLENKAFKA